MEKADEQKHEESGNKKRLLSGGGSKIPATTTTTAHTMKTRDLPNLSECQSCGFRPDTCTAGKITMQILFSEWRIVLVCHKCLSRVESSQICSYCFKQITQEDDFFTCCQCNRCVHRNCFYMYKSVAPWSYSSSDAASQFSYCVDCWVPKSIIRKRGFFRARESSNDCPELYNSNSGVKNCARSSLEPNFDVAPTMSRNAVVAKKAVKSSDQGCGNGKKKMVDDAELAFQLHREMNSSPRISKNFHSENSSCSSVRKIMGLDDDSIVGGLDSGNSYVKSNGNSLVCVESENVAVPFKEGEGSCSDKLVRSSGDENSMNIESVCCQNNQDLSSAFMVEIDDGKPDRYLLKYKRRNSSAKGFANMSKTLYEMLADRFLFKYYRKRRNSIANGTSSVKPKTLSERFSCQRETLDTRYLFKYRRRKTSFKAVPTSNR
ncbi:hypothetical protein Ddye_001992 [Dipteronia dyeriana]|uniref:Uncharacterized protein n=1 Tax=Dipteronia dyeriana TaxID=168575 RepID=A0AAE0CUJ4_9ROSI|nr:hypothetical protein Ddye_001992 [Dipteronia dyeriana]